MFQIFSLYKLFIEDQTSNALGIGFVNDGALTQMPFGLGRFGRRNMFCKSMVAFDFARAGFSEPFCCRTIGLDLWHIVSLLTFL